VRCDDAVNILLYCRLESDMGVIKKSHPSEKGNEGDEGDEGIVQ
jgi:hypothetical protein